MNKKLFKPGFVKSVNEEKHTLTAYVSTFEWDRTDERFAKGAWRLENFKKNPVVLWAHDSVSPPIAKAVSITEDDKGLLTEMLFDDKSDFAKHVLSLYARDFLKSFSVGFRASKFMVEPIEGTERKGLVWTDAELLEYSAVPIPANPGATISKDLGEQVIQVLGEKSGGLVMPVADGSGNYLVQDITLAQKNPAPEDLIQALKQMIGLSKIVEKQPLDGQKLSLINSAIDVIKENLIGDYQEFGISIKELEDLQGLVQQAGELLNKKYPDVNDLVSKLLTEMSSAIRR